MAKESFLNKAIKKALNTKTDATWNAHAKVFGSLMRSIFIGNEKARAKLCLALTNLGYSKPDVTADILEKEIRPLCQTDEEMTAYLYFSALACEAMKKPLRAYSYLSEALTYEPKSFRVYYKAANYAYADGMFGLAEENYKKAIRFMEEDPSDPAKDYTRFLSTTYCKLALSQTMLHRYDDAEQALSRSEEITSPLPEREHAKAVLYAARGETKRVQMCLGLLELEADFSCWEKADALTKEILSGKHPQFSKIAVSEEEIHSFWLWFSEKFTEYQPAFPEKAETFAKEISAKLRAVFPFSKKTIDVSIDFENGAILFFADYYAKAISSGLETLFENQPESLRGHIRLVKIH